MRFGNIALDQSKIGVATITFDNPQARNSFTRDQRRDLLKAIDAALGSEARAIVFTGAGSQAFSAGQATEEQVAPDAAAEWMREWGDIYQRISGLDIPTVAAINGFAAGAGLQIALVTDIRIAAEDAEIVFNEIDKGIPVITGTGLSIDLTSMSIIQDLVLTGRTITGTEAKATGLISRSVPRAEFQSEVDALAERLASVSPTAVKLNKQWWRHLRNDLLGRALVEGERCHPIAYAAARSI